MINYKHWMPPTLGDFKGKRYLLPIWKEVPANTTLEDIQWEKENIQPPIKKEPKIIVETFVSSSDDSILYETKKIEQVNGNFIYSCTCPGAWRAKDKRCKHIKELEKRD
jgi:hypothetical protein